MGGTCSSHGRNAYRMLTGKTDGKIPLGKLMRSLWDNIKMDLKKIGCDVMEWIHMPQYRAQWWALVNMVVSLRVPMYVYILYDGFCVTHVTDNLHFRATIYYCQCFLMRNI
jgi:hypothetical protein